VAIPYLWRPAQAREVRVAPTKREAIRVAHALVAENIKKGWNKAVG
jgi:hypothetical protein